jgi:putative cell wall-binding protein
LRKFAAVLLTAVLSMGSIVAVPAIAHAAAPQRYAGADRYEVAVNIAQNFGPGVPVVYIAKGTNYPDSLSAAPAAAAQGGPLLLVQPNDVPAVVEAELNRLQPQKIVVVGGEMSVLPEVFDQLATYVPAPADITRIGGADRFEASRNLNTFAFGASGVDRVYLATGLNFPDALAASAVAGSHLGAVLLVDGRAQTLDQATIDELALLGPDNVVVAGGPNSVSDGIELAVAQLGFPGGSQRLFGADRFLASQAINHEAYATADTVYLATGLNFPDALAGAALAGRDAGPLYVVNSTCVPQQIIADINAFGDPQIVLFGGPNSLSPAVESLTPCPISPTGTAAFTCNPAPALTVTVTNPNSYPIPVEVGLDYNYDGLFDETVTTEVPALTTATIPGPTPAEDSGPRVYARTTGDLFLFIAVYRNCTPTVLNPGDTKNCSDFATWQQANEWFRTYYPEYGDVANLDADGNQIPCESLPGAP